MATATARAVHNLHFDLPPLPYATDHRLQEMDFGDWTKQPEGTDRLTPTSALLRLT